MIGSSRSSIGAVWFTRLALVVAWLAMCTSVVEHPICSLNMTSPNWTSSRSLCLQFVCLLTKLSLLIEPWLALFTHWWILSNHHCWISLTLFLFTDEYLIIIVESRSLCSLMNIWSSLLNLARSVHWWIYVHSESMFTEETLPLGEYITVSTCLYFFRWAGVKCSTDLQG